MLWVEGIISSEKLASLQVYMPSADWLLSVSTADVRKTLITMTVSKVAAADNIDETLIKYSSQLADVVTEIFSISLSQKAIHISFKAVTIAPVPNTTNKTKVPGNLSL